MAINNRADPVHMVKHGHIAVVQNKQQQQHSSQQLQQIRMSVFAVYHVSLYAKIRFAPTAGLTPNKKPLEHTLYQTTFVTVSFVCPPKKLENSF